MSYLKKSGFLKHIFKSAPLIILFIAVLNEFDANYFGIPFLSINLAFILIFFWTLKNIEQFGYGYIFLAGLFNDVVIGYPIGLSCLTYLLICGFSAYLKNITLRANLVNEWLFFLFTILVVTSLNYFLLISIFSIEFNYYELLGNIFFTFILYYVFAYIFNIYQKLAFKGQAND